MPLNRRHVLATGAAAAVSTAGSGQAQTSADEAKTFVLMHGTWHGGWVWKDVAERLRAKGHVVYTPTLTGCGERKHLASPDVGLDTHITDITNVINYEELNDVILVGHSFTGIAITGAADRMRDKIRRLVFFDALVPAPGRMSGVSRKPDGGLPDYWLKRQEKFIDGYMMDFWEEYPLEMLVPDDAVAERERLTRLITPHPARGWSDELVLENGGYDGLPRTFIHCVGQEYALSSERMVAPAREPGWDFREVDIPRNGMMTHPDLVADLFGDLT